jgi:hypothetical protein
MPRILALTTALAAVLCLTGCQQLLGRRAAAPADPPPVQGDAAYLQKSGAAKDAGPPLPTAVETTLLLQDKYARVLEDLGREQQRSRELTEQNQKLSDTVARLQADLAKAQQELGEANNLLVLMKRELEKWKTDVLGYRDESRKVHETELEALAKILTLLGGAIPTGEAAGDRDPSAHAAGAPPAEVKAAAAPESRPRTPAETKPASATEARSATPAAAKAGRPPLGAGPPTAAKPASVATTAAKTTPPTPTKAPVAAQNPKDDGKGVSRDAGR